MSSPLPVEPAVAPRRYAGVSIALHWLIAALVALQLGLGWYMNEIAPDHSPQQDQIQDIHIEFGLLLLILVLVRIASRFIWRAPRMEAALAPWERALAQGVHYLLYALILVIPLLGWAMLTARHGHISFFGIAWPGLPGLLGAAGANVRAWGRLFKSLHVYWLIWALLIALFFHVAGAVKHQFDGHPVLWRMVPFLKKPAAARENDA
jgi:cytochrome b561